MGRDRNRNLRLNNQYLRQRNRLQARAHEEVLAQNRHCIEPGHRMSVEELTQHAQRAYPTYGVDNIRESQTPDEPDDVVLERAHKRIERLFDPYTGLDLGNPHSVIDRIVGWLSRFT